MLEHSKNSDLSLSLPLTAVLAGRASAESSHRETCHHQRSTSDQCRRAVETKTALYSNVIIKANIFTYIDEISTLCRIRLKG